MQLSVPVVSVESQRRHSFTPHHDDDEDDYSTATTNTGGAGGGMGVASFSGSGSSSSGRRPATIPASESFMGGPGDLFRGCYGALDPHKKGGQPALALQRCLPPPYWRGKNMARLIKVRDPFLRRARRPKAPARLAPSRSFILFLSHSFALSVSVYIS